MSTKEAREIAAEALLWVSDEHQPSVQAYINTGVWTRQFCGQDRCDAVAQRITEYGETCAHNAAMEER